MKQVACTTVVATLAAILAVCGCASKYRNRDQFLLSQADTTSIARTATGALPIAADVVEAPELNSQAITISPTEPLSLQAAIGSALRNSNVVRVADGGSIDASRSTFYDIEISTARINQALSAFDANFTADFLAVNKNNPPNAFFGPGLAQPLERDELNYGMGLEKRMATGAQAAVAYNPNPGYLFIPNSGSSAFNPRHIAELEFSVKQPLLQGAGLPINVAPITVTKIAENQSTWEFKKSVMASVRSVVEAYWDLYAARQTLRATEEVLPLLEEIVRLQKAALKAEWVILADVAKAEAELYRYRQEFVAARSRVVEAELQLNNLIGVAPRSANDTPLELATQPLTMPIEFSHHSALDQAMFNNPDLAQGRLDVALRKLELFVARNEFKPSLDLVALYRMNGIGQDLGNAIAQMSTAEFADWELGTTFSIPVGRRQARARNDAARQGLIKQQQLLQQTATTVSYELIDQLRRIEFSQLQLVELEKSLQAANAWVDGAHLRYQNPNPEDESATGLLEILNDYLRALRFRTDSISQQADVIAEYNSAMIRLEETKGTLLDFFAIAFPADPCSQLQKLPHTNSLPRENWQTPPLPVAGEVELYQIPPSLPQTESSPQAERKALPAAEIDAVSFLEAEAARATAKQVPAPSQPAPNPPAPNPPAESHQLNSAPVIPGQRTVPQTKKTIREPYSLEFPG